MKSAVAAFAGAAMLFGAALVTGQYGFDSLVGGAALDLGSTRTNIDDPLQRADGGDRDASDDGQNSRESGSNQTSRASASGDATSAVASALQDAVTGESNRSEGNPQASRTENGNQAPAGDDNQAALGGQARADQVNPGGRPQEPADEGNNSGPRGGNAPEIPPPDEPAPAPPAPAPPTAPTLLEVPQLLRVDVNDVEDVLESAGLELGDVETVSSEAPRDTVLDQSPPAGELVNAETEVTVIVSDGPDSSGPDSATATTPEPSPSPEPSPTSAPVPTTEPD
jgi:hypothetical protein